jgi:hypothetical protein
MHGIFDEKNPNDMVEYHVILNGVDEEAVLSFARKHSRRSRSSRIGPVNLKQHNTLANGSACIIPLE